MSHFCVCYEDPNNHTFWLTLEKLMKDSPTLILVKGKWLSAGELAVTWFNMPYFQSIFNLQLHYQLLCSLYSETTTAVKYITMKITEQTDSGGNILFVDQALVVRREESTIIG